MKKMINRNVNYLLIRGGGLVSLQILINKGIINNFNIKTIKRTNRNISLSL